MNIWLAVAICYAIAMILPFLGGRYLMCPPDPGTSYRRPQLRISACYFGCLVIPIFIPVGLALLVMVPTPSEVEFTALLATTGLVVFICVIWGWLLGRLHHRRLCAGLAAGADSDC